MKITIQSGDATVAHEVTSEDLDSTEVLRNFHGLMVAYGYHAESVNVSILELAEEIEDDENEERENYEFI